MTKGYKIDFTTNTLIMNYKFAAAASVYGSEAYNIRKSILDDFPSFSVIVKSGREQKKPRYNKRLTYKNMKKYIGTFANSEELSTRFEIVKTKSAPLACPYKYVCDWFNAQFPQYKEVPDFEPKNISVLPVSAPNADEYETKEEKIAK